MPCVLDIVCRPDHVDLVIDGLWQLGTTGVAEIVDAGGMPHLLAGFDGDADTRIGALVGTLGSLISEVREAEPVEPLPAAETWRAHANPIHVGGFVVRLPEHPAPDRGRDLCIEPGDAFGSGSHATTRLALDAVVRAMERRGPCTVADIGTGTGVLAIAAALAGATRVVAVDIEPSAAAIATANAARNHVGVEVLVGSAEDLAPDTFDLVVANLTFGIQRSVATSVAALLAPGATVILTGILRDHREDAAACYPTLRPRDHHHEGHWACITLGR